MNNIQKLARELAECRKEIQVHTDHVAELHQALSITPEYTRLAAAKDAVKVFYDTEAHLKQQLSQAMLVQYELDSTKNWDNIGKVINTKSVEIVDSEALLAWAKNHNLFLVVDEKAIKRVAEEVKPDGVAIITGNATRIDSDLSSLLED